MTRSKTNKKQDAKAWLGPFIAKFGQIGARAKVGDLQRSLASSRGMGTQDIRLDVLKDGRGTFFDIRGGKDVDFQVLDVQPQIRHLLLMARTPGKDPRQPDHKGKFLLGRDERDWFVAAVPDSVEVSVSSVKTAMEALKPRVVRTEVARKRVASKKANKRKNDGFKRQGEWFFLSRPDLKVDPMLILKNEPLQRGRSKPHRAEFLYREGGTTVYVNRTYPNGLSKEAYARLLPEERKRGAFRTMMRNPRVYVRGKIRHVDHHTLTLDCWHEVHPNTEAQAAAMKGVAFLD